MKKLNLLIVVFFFSVSALFSKSVDATHAMQVAQNFYKQMTGQTVTMTLAYQSTNNNITNGVAIGEPLYYAFNASSNGGFVMVSAEDLVKPIIGYNTQGQFVIQNAPPVIADWFVKYNKQIAYAKVTMTATTQAVTDLWTNYSQDINHVTKQLRTGGAVGPLVSTTWDQPFPYNADCPTDASAPSENNGRVLTGCGATAMSQIMRYWSYPPQGTGTNSYQSNYGTLTVNFGTTTYNWANMPYSDDPNNPSADIATLMYDAGVAVDMMYGPTESSSYILPGTGVPASCEAAYTTYFGYDPTTIQGYQRANYSVEADWLSLIDGEMAASRPIQYAGSGSDGGHTFVLDGADGNGNYHINWGWSGIDNGYYSVDALIPAPYSNGDFSNGEEMVTGIQPPNTTVISSGLELYTAITVTPDPIQFLTTFTDTAEVINNGSTNFSGDYCAALFDATGTFIRFIGVIYSTSGLQPNYYNTLVFNDTSTGVTAPGTYTIGVYYAPTGATTWTLVPQGSYTNPITVTVNGANDPGIALYSYIAPLPTTFTQGQAASVQVNLINDGTATYYGQYEAVLLDLQGNFVETIGMITQSAQGLAVNYYDSLLFVSNGIQSPEGEYILAIGEEAQGTSGWYYCGGQNYPNPVLINVVNGEINILAVQKVSADVLKVYPNPATNTVYIDAGDLRGSYTLIIFNTLGQQISENVGVLNGQKLASDVSSYDPGLYTIQLKTESGTLNSRVVIK
jgi:hypothetical protein